MSSLLSEALSIIERADEKGITLRLMGATAIKIHCPKCVYLHELLGRELTDFDVVGREKQIREIQKLCEEMGYKMAYLTSIQIGAKRRVFVKNDWKIDVFLDKLIMSHTIDLNERLEIDYPTIPLADLFLEKMQIAQLNEKDIKDAITLLREHDIGDIDHETLNCEYIAEILSKDYGFYVTVLTNLKKVKAMLSQYAALQEADRADITNKINETIGVIEAKPKSFGWKLKAKLGIKGCNAVDEFEPPPSRDRNLRGQ